MDIPIAAQTTTIADALQKLEEIKLAYKAKEDLAGYSLAKVVEQLTRCIPIAPPPVPPMQPLPLQPVAAPVVPALVPAAPAASPPHHQHIEPPGQILQGRAVIAVTVLVEFEKPINNWTEKQLRDFRFQVSGRVATIDKVKFVEVV